MQTTAMVSHAFMTSSEVAGSSHQPIVVHARSLGSGRSRILGAWPPGAVPAEIVREEVDHLRHDERVVEEPEHGNEVGDEVDRQEKVAEREHGSGGRAPGGLFIRIRDELEERAQVLDQLPELAAAHLAQLRQARRERGGKAGLDLGDVGGLDPRNGLDEADVAGRLDDVLLFWVEPNLREPLNAMDSFR